MSHPCNHFSCMENYHGECYGMGCRLNPMPDPSKPDAEDGDDDSDNEPTTKKTKGENTHEHQ